MIGSRVAHPLPGINDLPLSASDLMFFTRMDELTRQKHAAADEPQSNTSTSGSIKGSWSASEDELLRAAVARTKPVLWDVVAESVPGRTAIQCKERWMYRLDPNVKKTKFERWEDEVILRERQRVGNRWTLIANKLPGRTPCAVKNRWYSILRNASVTFLRP